MTCKRICYWSVWNVRKGFRDRGGQQKPIDWNLRKIAADVTGFSARRQFSEKET